MNTIKTIFLDIDGTITDGKIYYGNNGEEFKAFNIKDGLIISSLTRIGYRFIVVTGRISEIVTRRMNELNVNEVYQGISAKQQFIEELTSKLNIELKECGYLGDDLNDYCVMKKMGFRGCPADAASCVKDIADYISPYKGGEGAARDILEYLVKQNNDWEKFIALFL